MQRQIISFLMAAGLSVYAGSAQDQVEQLETRMDSIPEYAGSTTFNKDSHPLQVSGSVAVRLKNMDYYKAAPLQKADRSRTVMDAVFLAGFAATPNSNVNMWATLALPFDFSGYFTNQLAKTPNDGPYNQMDRAPFHHSFDYYGATLFENLTAGIDVRGGGLAGMLKAGGVIWANASPLTLWEREASPRFVSQYELFEEEKTVSTYYKEKTFRPVKEGGRAFWTNRSLGGVMLDMYQLPWDLKAQIILSQPADMDQGTRDGLRVLGSQPGEIEMTGDMDLRGDVFNARISKQKIAETMEIGANFLGINFDRDIIYEPEFKTGFKDDIKPYLIYNRIASIDVKGNVNPMVHVKADLAMSWDDTVTFISEDNQYDRDDFVNSRSGMNFGFYSAVRAKYWQPMTLEAIYLPKDFYSPYGMSNNSRMPTWRRDEMYLGAGTFRYTPNLMGLNLKFEPELNRGRFDVQYGQHKQVEKGFDALVFNYRLNGRTQWESTNSWTKHKPIFNMDSGIGNTDARYISRLGNEKTELKLYRQYGGLYGGTWEMWESFVSYGNATDAAENNIPQHVKWSSVLSIDAGYDIGHWFGTDRNIMLTAYATLSGISTGFVPLPVSESQSDMLLWGFYGQSEPAIAITPNFHAILILGYETWRAEQAYVKRSFTSKIGANVPEYDIIGEKGTYITKEPINYQQTAIGFGFDWDFTSRAGLHFRYKHATHSDESVSENNWKAHFIQAETKLWF